jgi:hypothetical protein
MVKLALSVCIKVEEESLENAERIEKMVETTCSYCGKTIKKRPREIKLSNNLFCNRECYYSFRQEHGLFKHSDKSKELKKILHFAKLKGERNKPKSL